MPPPPAGPAAACFQGQHEDGWNVISREASCFSELGLRALSGGGAGPGVGAVRCLPPLAHFLSSSHKFFQGKPMES